MLSITEVPRNRLYRPNMASSLPQLRPKKPTFNTKQQLATQKLFAELNAEFLDNTLVSKRHSINTQIQTDSFMNQTQPKIDLISHQTENLRNTIDSLDKRVDSMCAEPAAKLKRLSKDMDIKTTLLANKTNQEIKNTQEINEKYQKHVEWVTTISQSKLQELFADQGALKEKSDNLALSTEAVLENARGKLKIMTPRVTQLDMNAQEVDSTIQRLLAEQKAMAQVLAQLKETRKTLKYIEEEGVANMISEHFTKLVSHLSEETNNIDKKTMKKEIQEGDCEENIKMSAAENENLVSRLDQLSKQIQDNDTNINSFTDLSEQQIETTVERLNDVVSQLKEELGKRRHDSRHGKWLSQRNSIREMKYQSKVAQQRADKLQNDWVLFNTNNTETQDEVNKQIDELYGKFDGDLEIISHRVDVCYEKIQWCRKRLLQWQRYNPKELEVSIQKIIDAEKNLLDIENSLKTHDKQKPVAPPYKFKKGTYKSIDTEPPPDIEDKEAIEEQIPDKQLTYKDEELNQPDEAIPHDEYEEEDFVDSDDDEKNLFMMDSEDENDDYNNNKSQREDDYENDANYNPPEKGNRRKPKKQDDDENEQDDEQEEQPDQEQPSPSPKKRRRRRKTARDKPQNRNPPVNDPEDEPEEEENEQPEDEPEKKHRRRHHHTKDGDENDEDPPATDEHRRKRKRKA